MSEINIFGNEFEVDFLDADVLEKYLNANQKVLSDINDQKTYEGKTEPDKIRVQCRIINEFFDSFLGEGTSERLFNGKSNLGNHMEAFAIVTEAAQKSDQVLTSISDRYSINRATRRANNQQQNRGSKNNYGPIPYKHGKNK